MRPAHKAATRNESAIAEKENPGGRFHGCKETSVQKMWHRVGSSASLLDLTSIRLTPQSQAWRMPHRCRHASARSRHQKRHSYLMGPPRLPLANCRTMGSSAAQT